MYNFLEDIRASLERVEEVRCLNDANASPQVATIDAYTNDLAKNWNPTGYYTPSGMEEMINQLTAAGGAARAALAQASYSTSDAGTVIKQAGAYLDRNDARGQLYRDAVTNAKNSSTTLINAPGFKDWVLKSLVNVSQAYVTVMALDCRTTWLDTAAAVAAGIVSTAKRIGGIVMKAGDTLLKVTEGIFDLYPKLKWAVLGVVLLFGGIFIYRYGMRFYADEVRPRMSWLDNKAHEAIGSESDS